MLTNKLNLPQPFVEAAMNRRKVVENEYSVTTLLKGTCEIILSRRHYDEVDEDVSDRVWAILGSAVHKIIEQAQEGPEQLQEVSLRVPLGKYTLTGIFDLYDDSSGTVTDWKTASVIKWQKGEFDDYRKQTLMYAWMLRQYDFDAHRAEIVMLLRDWVQSKAKFDSDYPDTQAQKIEFEFDINDFRKIYRWILDKFHDIEAAEKLSDEDLTPCSEEERWHRPDSWAVVKDGNKKAYRVLYDEVEAQEMAESLTKDGKKYHLEYRKGEDAKCDGYCAYKKWCPLWKDVSE